MKKDILPGTCPRSSKKKDLNEAEPLNFEKNTGESRRTRITQQEKQSEIFWSSAHLSWLASCVQQHFGCVTSLLCSSLCSRCSRESYNSNTYTSVVFDGKHVGISVSDLKLQSYCGKPLPLKEHRHSEHVGQDATKTTNCYQSKPFSKTDQLETHPKFRLPAPKVAPIKTKIRTLRNAMKQKIPTIEAKKHSYQWVGDSH